MTHGEASTVPFNNRYVVVSLLLLVLLATAMSIQNFLLPNSFVYSGRTYTQYNNYVIFIESFSHLRNGENLYTPYPDLYADLFKYSPTFALLMAPFKALPAWVGLCIWNVSGVVLLFAGLRHFALKPGHILLFVVMLLPETAAAISNSQSNNHIAGLLLLSANAMERGKPGLSTFLLVCTIYIKIFTAVLVLFYLFYPKVYRSAAWFVLWAMVFFAAPALATGMSGLTVQYLNWWEMISADHARSIGYSLAGILDSVMSKEINKDIISAIGGIFLLLPLIKWKSFSDPTFRMSYFAIVLVWMVIFNHKAESPTFIIAMTGIVLLAHVNDYKKRFLVLLCASLVFTSLTSTDICPAPLRKGIIEPYKIKALLPSVTFFFAVFFLLFQGKNVVRQDQAPSNSRAF